VTRSRGGPRQREGVSLPLAGAAARDEQSDEESVRSVKLGRFRARGRADRSRGDLPAVLAQQADPALRCGGWGVPVAESVLAPPGPIPNPVVTQRSAGEYYGGDPMGGEAAADTPQPRVISGAYRVYLPAPNDAGWSSGSSLGS
jgi:hypothetical protein